MTNETKSRLRAMLAADERRIRAEALEEAAKVADAHASGLSDEAHWTGGRHESRAARAIASAIRALATGKDGA